MELEGGHRFSEGKRIIGGLRYPFKSRGLSTGVKVRMLMGTLDSSVPYISKQLVLNNKKTKKNKVLNKKYLSMIHEVRLIKLIRNRIPRKTVEMEKSC